MRGGGRLDPAQDADRRYRSRDGRPHRGSCHGAGRHPFVVQVTSVGCDLAYGGADIEGVDLTPYELYFDPPRYDCTKDMMELTTLHHAMQLRFDTPGIRTLWIHVLRDGEIVHIPVDVDAQP